MKPSLRCSAPRSSLCCERWIGSNQREVDRVDLGARVENEEEEGEANQCAVLAWRDEHHHDCEVLLQNQHHLLDDDDVCRQEDRRRRNKVGSNAVEGGAPKTERERKLCTVAGQQGQGEAERWHQSQACSC